MTQQNCINIRALNTVTEARTKNIQTRFVEYGCADRFELMNIVDGTHVTVRCKTCGNQFERETSFLKPRNKDKTNIECRCCGMHADGTIGATAKSENKRGMSDGELIAYYNAGNSASKTAEHFGVNLRRVTRAIDKAGVSRSKKQGVKQDKYRHETTGIEYLDEELTCKECGREFTRHEYTINSLRENRIRNWTPSYCCRDCMTKALSRSGRTRRRRRERKLTFKPIPLAELIKRDNGICQLCGEPVDLTDGWYDERDIFHVGRNYPTVDHIKPLAHGGDNEWSNVQLAHQHCNSSKCDRID